MHAGVAREGIVNRVTKRVTVLVPCRPNDEGAREFSNKKFYKKYLVPLEQVTLKPH